jgi:hypothetical protein
MTTRTRYAQVRAHCQELVATMRMPRRCGTDEFADAVGRLTGTKVRLAPLRLPPACTTLWLGYTSADSIGYNQDWPAQVISLAGHAVGHLALGHCDEVRDGGQSACTVGRLDTDDRYLLDQHLHDPAVSRLFSDGEEYAATVFAHVLAEWLGIQNGRAGSRGLAPTDVLTCIG